MSDYCIDHLSLVPMTAAELKTHIYERHEFDFDVSQICDYRCEYCDKAFISCSDAFNHKSKKGHEISKYGPQLEDELKEILTKEFEEELERCKRAEPHVREELADLQRKKDCLRSSLPKPKNRYSLTHQKEGQPIASSTASTTRAVLEEHIPFCERNLAQINVKPPLIREVTDSAVDSAEEPEELDLEVEEEEELEDLPEGDDEEEEEQHPLGDVEEEQEPETPPERDEEEDNDIPLTPKRRRLSPSPQPSKASKPKPASFIGERVASRRRAEAQLARVSGRTKERRSRRIRRPTSLFGESVSSETFSRSTSGETTPQEAIRRAGSPPAIANPDGSQSEKRGRGRPRKNKEPEFTSKEDHRASGGNRSHPAVDRPLLAVPVPAPSGSSSSSSRIRPRVEFKSLNLNGRKGRSGRRGFTDFLAAISQTSP